MSVSLRLRKRIVFLLFLFTAVMAMMLGRTAWIQIVKGSELQNRALDTRMHEVPVEAKRGIIYDRNGRELAISISADSVGAFPPEIKASEEAEKIAEQLSTILAIPQEEILNKITANSYFVWIKRRLTAEEGQSIRKLDLKGIQVVEENQRYYPNDRLASHVLGFAGVDNQGLEGVEVMFDKELKGKAGNLLIEFDAAGREIPQATHRYQPPENGNNLVLTIDEGIQYIAERELDTLMLSETSPKSATIIVMDPKSGEVLALASRPNYDPNNFREFPGENWRNIAVSNAYEPGSTFKIVTASAALEEGVVTPEDRFYDPGYIKVGSETIKCWRSYNPHGSESFVEGVMNSCNPVFVEVGLRIDNKAKGLFYKYINGFGFGRPTGIDLPGEAKGIMIPEKSLKQINIATISIGQSIAVTPIQMVTAMSAIANGGSLLKPHLVKEVRDGQNRLIKEIKPEPVRRVISEETSEEMRSILEKVVSQGTGSGAYIPGYRVGGKTGTAQKAGKGGYQQGKYVASFLGMAPVNDPRLVTLVVIDEPQGVYYGGQIAAPIFKRVMEDSLRYLGVKPQYDPKVEAEKELMEQETAVVPDVSGLTPERAAQVLYAERLVAEKQGNGGIVAEQLPKAGAKVAAGTKILLYLKELPGSAAPEVIVPDLTGKRVPEVSKLLELYGLRLEIEGSGLAVEQDPIPGARVGAGTPVTVKMAETAEQEVFGP